MEKIITVKGTGNISVKPDLIVITMTVVSQNYDYDKTMQIATESINELENAIEDAGFNKEDLKTTSFNIRTNYKNYYDEKNNYKEKFDGYIVEQSLKLEFDLNMDVLSEVLTAIVKSETDPRFNIRFSVKDKDAVNQELLIKATENARRKAEILTKASRVGLGRLISIDYSWNDVEIYSKTAYAVESKNVSMAYAPNINPDNIDMSDTVTFIWEIK